LLFMIALNGIMHQYKAKTSLSLDFWQAQAAEQWLLRGKSGSGKTTFLHILAGLLKPTKGSVNINGTELTTLQGSKLDKFRGQEIGIVFQQPYLVKTLNVWDNLQLANKMADKKVDKVFLLQLLEKLDILNLKNQFPHQLSVGEAQRLCIARALANKPTILLADEPTSALDDDNALLVAKLLQTQAKEQNATLVIATHDSRLEPYFSLVKHLNTL
jgi:putative ABC transport system ATP-binding protein